VGSHSITASYAGDPNFTSSVSASLAQTVARAATSTAVASSANPSVSGQSVTFTATVSATAPGAGTPSGTVTFFDGATSLGTGTLSGGVATLSVSNLSVASHSITASYNGDANFNSSTSGTLTQTVNMDGTATSLASSVNPTVYGQSVTFTATVSAAAPGSGTPTGTVTFMDGATTLGTGTLSGGTASFTTSSLAAGSHSITAVYGGNPSFNASTSSALGQTVNMDATTTTLTSSANPAALGSSVTFTATVSANAPGSGTPTGTVTFFDGGTPMGTSAVNASGQAAFSTSSLRIGNHSITATYNGDGNFTTSTSPVLSEQIKKKHAAPVQLGSVPSNLATSAAPTGPITTSPGGGDVLFTSAPQDSQEPTAALAGQGSDSLRLASVTGAGGASASTLPSSLDRLSGSDLDSLLAALAAG
jgi:hypothetical protein